MNSLGPDLKFTKKVGSNSSCFLDLKIRIINGQLEIAVYRKSTDSHLYLHAKSCDNPFTIRDIQKDVALCL